MTETDLSNLHLEMPSPDTVDVPHSPAPDEPAATRQTKSCRRCAKDFTPRPRQQICDGCKGSSTSSGQKRAAPKSAAATKATADTLAKLLTGATVLYAMWLTQPFPSIEDTTEYELEDAEAAAIASPLARVLVSAAPQLAQRITGSEDLMLAVFATVSYAQRVYPMHKQRTEATRKTPKPRQQERMSREAGNVNGQTTRPANPDVIRYGLNTWQLDT